MTRALKTTYVSALIVGLLAGGTFGFRYATDTMNAYYESKGLVAHVFQNFSYAQYRRADFTNAKASLMAFAHLLEEMEKLQPNKPQERELANTYTRLALLEDATNDKLASQAFMTKAQFWRGADPKNGKASDSEMKTAVQKMDVKLDRFRNIN